MQIEIILLIIGFVIAIGAFVFVRLCYLADKRKIENEVLNNKTVFFVDHAPLTFDDIDFDH